MKLVIFNHGWEGILFDTGGLQVDAAQDTGIEDVETSVNSVTDELDWFFDESFDF